MPLDTADIRRRNLGLVLGCVLEADAAARSDIADATGLSRGAVTSLVADLVEAGLVRESSAIAAAKGRPRVLLEPAGDDVCLVTALLDADHATAVVSDIAGDTLARVERRHGRPFGDPAAVASVLASVIDEAVDAVPRRIADLSVVVWAPVGGDPAVVLADTDLGWGEVDVIALLRDRSRSVAVFDRSISLRDDATVAARAEHAARGGIGSLLYLKGDSGIGGATVFDQTPPLVIGGALGHVPIVPDGELCACGQRGCLVTVAGPDILLERAGLTPFAEESGLTSALDEFIARVRAGEPAAIAAWSHGRTEIARALQITAMTLAPQLIVLGGFLADLAADVDATFASIQPHILGAGDYPTARVVASAFGKDAALVGAQRAARERLLADPLAF
ncbi:ROK family transcriptional regulator [Microbacterium candidum]|uniref:ROK family transcriptional regulator n=1 Tax=Microbacterium candidum TaxID=3041922 RepID=A0ABT7MXQ8_9MICO|nr:ROK family transcriptional regulator [Microbacterium sp. ASV49]MDL9979236.1 ROK family transcriptional regulator [Microbacterium sp. ASV49]